MRPRNSATADNTCFQESGPFHPQIDIKADAAVVYGLSETFEDRLAAWTAAGYTPHVMTGVAWGQYQDYIRGDWDGELHHDDAQMAAGDFRLEHGVKQDEDIYYMVPTRAYTAYLIHQLRRVVDAGAKAIHLEEPEFWVRAGYSPSFKREWAETYGEPWQDPVSSPDARYKTASLKQQLYTRSLDDITRELKAYAATKGNPDFKCYVPTHSLINYAHWRIVSPEGGLCAIPGVDGIIAQVWTGTARTPNVYEGRHKERTFEAAYCEYAATAALARGTDFRVWALADPIEDNPNYAWPDYRINWECTVAASLLFPEITRFEVTPWPSRVFQRTYPAENLGGKPLAPMIDDYLARLEDQPQKLADARAAFAAFQEFVATMGGSPVETLGFSNQSYADSPEMSFGAVLDYGFAFYQHLSATRSPEEGLPIRDTLADFYMNPPVERQPIPQDYTAELETVFNALADMDWPQEEIAWVDAPEVKIALAISDTLMYQRGAPEASDPDMSSVYGLTMPLLKRGVPLAMVQMERLQDPSALPANLDVLILTYEGMKPPSADCHSALVQWVRDGGKLLLFGSGDAYDSVRSWWNENGKTTRRAQDDLTEKLGLGIETTAGIYPVGKGLVSINPASPSNLAHDAQGSDNVWAHLNEVVNITSRAALILRRGHYVVAAGLDEVSMPPAVLDGTYVNLFDAELPVIVDPCILPGTRHLLVDVERANPGHAWVLAASGRVDDEAYTEQSLQCTISGPADSRMVMRAVLPRKPQTVHADTPVTHSWDEESSTLFVMGQAAPEGISLTIQF